MDKYIFHKKKALDKQKCDYIINLFEKSDPIYNEQHDYYAIYPDITDIKYQIIHSTLQTYLKEYGKKHTYLGKRPNWDIDKKFHVQKYNIGQYYDSWSDVGYWEGHCEHVDDKRILAWMFYLNDIKHKGGTHWPQQNFTTTPRAGDLYIWPAGWTHSHYGIVAPKEIKYIATGWAEMPP